MIPQFTNLPECIINEILSYDNVFRYRNGKWIGRIQADDYRSRLLETIPRSVTRIRTRWGRDNQGVTVGLGADFYRNRGFYKYQLFLHPDKTVMFICESTACSRIAMYSRI